MLQSRFTSLARPHRGRASRGLTLGVEAVRGESRDQHSSVAVRKVMEESMSRETRHCVFFVGHPFLSLLPTQTNCSRRGRWHLVFVCLFWLFLPQFLVCFTVMRVTELMGSGDPTQEALARQHQLKQSVVSKQ